MLLKNKLCTHWNNELTNNVELNYWKAIFQSVMQTNLNALSKCFTHTLGLFFFSIKLSPVISFCRLKATTTLNSSWGV